MIHRAHSLAWLFLISGVFLLNVQQVAFAAISFDGLLTNTNQIRTASHNPFFGAGNTQNLAGANFYYAPGGIVPGDVAPAASVNGVFFDNINLQGTTPPSGPFALSANGAGPTLTLNMPWDQTNEDNTRFLNLGAIGPDAATLNAVAHEMFYVSDFFTADHDFAIMTFSGLGANRNVYVQVIGGDQGWFADIAVTVNGTSIGTWFSVADGNPNNGSLFGFDTATDSAGSLALDFRAINDRYAGISGIIISGQGVPSVPEPASLLLWAGGSLALVGSALRRRRKP